MTFEMDLSRPIQTDTGTELDFTLNLPGLPLLGSFTKHGGVRVGVGFDYHFTFGVNASGGFIDNAAADDLQIHLEAELIGDPDDAMGVTDRYHDAGGTLGNLNADIRDDLANRSNLVGTYHVNFAGTSTPTVASSFDGTRLSTCSSP